MLPQYSETLIEMGREEVEKVCQVAAEAADPAKGL